MKKIILYLCFVLSALYIQAQTVICVSNNSSNNNIILRWTSSTNPCGPFVRYYIYGSNSPTGPFTLVDSTNLITDTSYTHVGALAINPTWYYYVTAIYNCPGFVPLASDTARNNPPAIPQIVSVSMGPKGAVIRWTPSTSPQTCFYVIYYDSIRGNSERHDTVWGRFNNIFVDSFFVYDANISPIYYTVEANDCCGGNNGPVRTPQRTIFLTYDILRCDGKVSLRWTPYVNWPNGGVRAYSILVSKNGSPYAAVGAVDSSTLGFDYRDFIDFDSICVVVAAISHDNVVSVSNQVCFLPSVVQKPDYVYVANISVNDREKIELNWIVDTMGEMYRYLIDRKTIAAPYLNEYDKIVARPFYSEFDTLVDTVADPSSRYYYYRVISDDSCSNKVTSTEGRSILLTVTLSNMYEFTLNWNPFELDNASVTAYEIWREQAGAGPILLTTIDRSSTSYVDDVSRIIDNGAYFCYRVVARFTLNLPDGRRFNMKSRSNRVCQAHRPIVYIPNAIVPDGENRIFKPSIIFGEVNGYALSIFNRWGEEIFTTGDFNQGWDGTKNGKPVPAGGYAYVIQFNGQDGNRNEYKGIVTVIR